MGGAARRNDPQTSKDAAAAFKPGSLYVPILAALQNGPMAEYEVSNAIDIDRRVSISPRFAQLRDKGLIRTTGTKKLNPTTNNKCQVWELVPAQPAGVSNVDSVVP